MESRNLIYKNGHFYDKETKIRVGLKEGAEIFITTQSEYFTSFAPAGSHSIEPLDKEKKERKILNDSRIIKSKKIYDRGSFLYFSFHRLQGRKSITHEFKVELLEELYLYLKKDWKLQEYRLYDCVCVVRENISGTVYPFEEVHAKSLNEAFKKTFVHYFGNKGNPACNAFDRFYDAPGNEGATIGRFRD